MISLESFGNHNHTEAFVPNRTIELPENGDDRRATELLLEKYQTQQQAENTPDVQYRIAILQELTKNQHAEPLTVADALEKSMGDAFDAMAFQTTFTDLDMELTSMWQHDGGNGDDLGLRHAA